MLGILSFESLQALGMDTPIKIKLKTDVQSSYISPLDYIPLHFLFCTIPSHSISIYPIPQPIPSHSSPLPRPPFLPSFQSYSMHIWLKYDQILISTQVFPVDEGTKKFKI